LLRVISIEDMHTTGASLKLKNLSNRLSMMMYIFYLYSCFFPALTPCHLQGYNSVYSSDSAEEAEREQSRKNALTSTARHRFEAMLRALSGKRGEIARCMTFSLEHAEAAHEVYMFPLLVAICHVLTLLLEGCGYNYCIVTCRRNCSSS